MTKIVAKLTSGWVFIRAFALARWGLHFVSRTALLTYQANAMRRHREKWWPQSDFYRPFVQQHDQIPLMDKATMMANFDALNTAGLTREVCMDWAQAAELSRDFSATLNGVTVGLSSGTSAVRGIFLATQREQAYWAGNMLAMLLPKPLYRRQRIALFLRAGSGLYDKLGKSHWVQFRFFDLSRPFGELIHDLKEFNPTVLVAPAQCLERLVDAQAILNIQPRQVIAVTECLPDDVRHKVEQTWHQRVDEIYQATEGFLAVSCTHGRLHLNEAFVHFDFEVLDAATHRVVPIITDFSRTTQLMVRYRLDDVLVLSDEHNCPCGQHSRIIDKIEGRCDDVLRLPKKSGGEVDVYPDYISRALLLVDGLCDFRVRQLSDHQLSIQYVGDSVDITVVQNAIQSVANLCDIDLAKLSMQIETVRNFETSLMHKRRRIIGLARRLPHAF